jgi:hypothetical protein
MLSGRLSILSDEGLLFAIAGAYAMAVLYQLPLELTQDSWFAFVSGREVAHHGLPVHDHLTYWTLGHRWIDQPWLAQLLLYAFVAAGGAALALFAHAVLVIGAFALALIAARRLGGSVRAVSWLTPLCVLPIAQSDGLRAQTLVYGLFVAVLWLLVLDSRTASRRIWLVVPLLAVWANLHGSVVLGAALVCLRGVALVLEPALRRTRPTSPQALRAGLLLVVPSLCTVASPYGFSLLHYYDSTLNNPGFTRVITEWKASTLDLFHLPFYALGFVAVWLMGRDRGVTLFERLALVFALAAALVSMRNQVWFGFTALLVLPGPLTRVLGQRRALDRRGLNAAIGLVGIVAALIALVSTLGRGRYERQFPAAGAAAVAAAAERDPNARIYSSIRFADFILWHEPQLRGRIAYDTRLEMLSSAQLADIFNWGSRIGTDWRQAAVGARIVVFDATTEGPVEKELIHDGAQRIFADHYITVLVRRV